ncbi:MAG: trypsin-like peptidase domain-containing protein [Rubricoccaceae bacterium]|nr:trypsin-like peptidase domain-containing protein [Rubricoccaceae bacterium]
MKHLSLLTLLVLAGCEQPAFSQQGVPAPQTVEVPPVEGAGALERLGDDIQTTRRTAITRAVEAATPAVVSINVIEERTVRYRDPFADFFDQFYGRRPTDRVYRQEVQGVGSGFVISPDGYIVTNDHVAGNATRITVAFPDGSQLPGTLVGSDPETDIALVKVNPDDPLPYLAFEQRQDAIVGEWAIALGNPFGLFEAAEPSVTVGVVSAVGRDFPVQEGRVFRDMIQTDAAINQGNSGGPLVNALGRVMGMNTFIYSRTGGSVGIGFAVPAWRITRVVEELQARGSVDRSFYTGLNVQPVSPRLAQALGLPEARGLVVRSVDPESPAEQGGFRPYDVVVAVEGQAVATNADVVRELVDFRAGDVVRLTVVREGEAVVLSLRLAPVG